MLRMFFIFTLKNSTDVLPIVCCSARVACHLVVKYFQSFQAVLERWPPFWIVTPTKQHQLVPENQKRERIAMDTIENTQTRAATYSNSGQSVGFPSRPPLLT